jgi:hypothetical protein
MYTDHPSRHLVPGLPTHTETIPCIQINEHAAARQQPLAPASVVCHTHAQAAPASSPCAQGLFFLIHSYAISTFSIP